MDVHPGSAINAFWDKRWRADCRSPNGFEQAKLAVLAKRFPRDVSTVLDLGCGRGWMLKALGAHYRLGVGVDFSLEGLRFVRPPAIQGMGTALPFKAASFDLVLCAEVLEHLDDHALAEVITEIRRVSRQYALVTTPHAERRELNMVRCEVCFTVFHSSLHVRSFDEESLEALFVRHGWRPVWIGTAGKGLYRSPFLTQVNRALTGYFPYWRPNLRCPVCGNPGVHRRRAREHWLSLILEGGGRVLTRLRGTVPHSLCALFRRDKARG